MNPQSNTLYIETPNLILRLLTPDDIPALLTYRLLTEVTRYLSKRPVTAESILDEIEYTRSVPIGTPGYRVRTVIVPKVTNSVVGDCIIKITEEDPQQGELTYALHPAHQGHGYATEAMRAFVGYAFGTLRLHRLTATIFAEHTPSIKVVERLGMRREAHFRQAVLRDGQWVDDTIYALLRDEWQAMQQRHES
jgi:[ribosomal protein S5]-alanine N-acetyltransferase